MAYSNLTFLIFQNCSILHKKCLFTSTTENKSQSPEYLQRNLHLFFKLNLTRKTAITYLILRWIILYAIKMVLDINSQEREFRNLFNSLLLTDSMCTIGPAVVWVLGQLNLSPLDQLTPWSRVLLEKLIVGWLIQKFPAFYGTWRYITMWDLRFTQW
jgi:hypothetical protein